VLVDEAGVRYAVDRRDCGERGVRIICTDDDDKRRDERTRPANFAGRLNRFYG
jgi:hypothetical protein